MKLFDNFLGKTVLIVITLIVVVGILMPGIEATMSWATQIDEWTLEQAAEYWESQGYVAYASPDGTMYVYDIEPIADDTYDIGTAVKRFQAIYGVSVYADGTLYVGSRSISDNGTQLKVDDTYIGAPGTPDYVVGVNTATDDVPGSTGYWVKSGATGEVARSTADADAGDDINYAIDSIIAGGGTVSGRVQLSAQQFTIATTIVIDGGGIILEGAKMGGRLVMANNANVNMISITEGGVVLQNLELRGNDANNVASSGIVMSGNALPTWISNVRVMDFDDYGIELQGSGTCYALQLDTVTVEDCGQHGIYLHDAGGHQLNHVLSNNNGGDGFRLITNAMTESILTNVNSDANGLYGFIIDTGTRFTMVGWKSQNNGYDGLRIANLTNSSITGGGTYDNLLVAGNFNVSIDNCAHLTFAGNTVVTTGSGGGHTALYVTNTHYSSFTANTIEHVGGRGISLDGAAVDNSFIGNTIDSGNTVARFFFTGTTAIDNEILGNMGYIASGEVRSRSGTLTAGVANAIFFAWHNPELQDILIKKVVIEITTPGGTALSVGQVGIADDAAGTGLGTEFFPAAGIDLNAAAIRDSWNAADTGVQVKFVFCDDSVAATNGWVVGKILVQNASNLVGKYYIEYVGR